METMTPMLKQYQDIKSQHEGCILFFRLGDFYEMFYDDAKTASSILDVVLTARGAGKAGKVPMCGIPYHAADAYISRLIKAGQKVAICEQLEDPSQAKGIVKRDVIRVITSGTFIDETSNDSRYLVCISFDKKNIGLAFTEATSGTIQVNQYLDKNSVTDVFSKLSAYECIYPASEEGVMQDMFNHGLLRNKNIVLTPYDDWCFNIDIAKKTLHDHFHTHNLRGFGIEDMPRAVSSAGALLEYLKQMNKQPMLHIDKLSLYTDTDYVYISPAACYGLELEELIKTLDRTLTPLGKRLFRYWVYHPLQNAASILDRQSAVTFLKGKPHIHQEITRLLYHMPDIEKSVSRISYGLTHAKDMLALRNALSRIPDLRKVVSPLAERNQLFSIQDIPQLRELLNKAVNPDVPLSHPEGRIIRSGYNEELDALRDIQNNGREWLKKLQAQEIKRTGINSLKIGFNKVFGYYIVVSKANLHLVPPDYIRKQTLVNAERYITPQLKEFEEKMLTAEEDVFRIERELLGVLQREILDTSAKLHRLASDIARLDVLSSLSSLALSPGYIPPSITDDSEIIIKDGRHPVVEQRANEPFIPNDTQLDCTENHLLIITGPNMSGKSTYIRQNAILAIMAQIGSYIPATSAKVGVVDKIFTRIGAHDDIAKGQSTFMVEMSETAGILNNLSPRSLVILDEIGRGTSTYDGLSLAWAIAEYLERHRIRTLFATHFHELTALVEKTKGVKNYNVAVKEWKDEIIFLHKIVPGGCDDSYGIYVAKLAGIPKEVIQRGSQILTQLELSGNLQDKIKTKTGKKEIQLTLFSGNEGRDKNLADIKKELDNIPTDSLTPIQALNKIHKWKEMLDKNGKD